MGGGFDSQSTSINSFSVDSIKLELPQPIHTSAYQKVASLSEILHWIDELWESGIMKEANTTYEEYIEFREAIKESALLH